MASVISWFRETSPIQSRPQNGSPAPRGLSHNRPMIWEIQKKLHTWNTNQCDMFGMIYICKYINKLYSYVYIYSKLYTYSKLYIYIVSYIYSYIYIWICTYALPTSLYKPYFIYRTDINRCEVVLRTYSAWLTHMCRFPQIRYSHIPQPFYHYILDGVLISAKLITLFRCVECDRYNAYPSSNPENGSTNLDLYATHPVFISDFSVIWTAIWLSL